MSTRSWVGVALALIVMALFGLYLHKGGALTATAGLIFGGGLMFCGVLIDAPDFMALFKAARGQPSTQYPPLPGGPDGTFPTGEGK